MSAKGRVKWAENRLPSSLGQTVLRPFDERSDPSKSKILRGSARGLPAIPSLRDALHIMRSYS